VPGLCDELRQELDKLSLGIHDIGEGGPWDWGCIKSMCSGKLSRMSRLKRVQINTGGREGLILTQSSVGMDSVETGIDRGCRDAMMQRCMEAPLLWGSNGNEYRLLARALSLNPSILQRVQMEFVIHPLPKNLMDIQVMALNEVAGVNQRTAYLRARRHICVHCLLTHTAKSDPIAGTLRLDTLGQKLVCATCLSQELIVVNLLGRVLSFRKHQYYLCPQCTTIQKYKGEGEQAWHGSAHAPHQCTHSASSNHRQSSQIKKKPLCYWCNEPAATQAVERVDHITGEMVLHYYCQRHCPRGDVLAKCYNVRQLSNLAPPVSRARQMLLG
jgi:hypothetical protein